MAKVAEKPRPDAGFPKVWAMWASPNNADFTHFQ
jgi:hypothetical protein